MAECRNCGAKVFWAFNEDGRSMGFDQGHRPDGEWFLDSAGIAERRGVSLGKRRGQGFREHRCFGGRS